MNDQVKSIMDEIIDTLNHIKSGYNPQDIFNDWVTMSAISLNNQLNFNSQLEDMYKAIASKYNTSQLDKFCKCCGLLVSLFELEIDDYLGKIYMFLGSGNSRTGQFFTPFHICEMMSRVALSGYDGSTITLNEPSAGGGANILSTAKAIKEMGYNYQEKMEVVSQDIDPKCSYMQYLQLSLTGISAEIINGDTLRNTVGFKLYTPMWFLKRGGIHEATVN